MFWGRFVAALNVAWNHVQRIQLRCCRRGRLRRLAGPDGVPIISADAGIATVVRSRRGRRSDVVAVLNFLLDCAVGGPQLLRKLQNTFIALYLAAALCAAICC